MAPYNKYKDVKKKPYVKNYLIIIINHSKTDR